MTAHELARKLLEGKDNTIVLQVKCANDVVTSTTDAGKPIDEIRINEGAKVVRLEAYIEGSQFGWLEGCLGAI